LHNEEIAASKKNEVKLGFDELHKQLVDCSGKLFLFKAEIFLKTCFPHLQLLVTFKFNGKKK
jgi:hypothetical protein